MPYGLPPDTEETQYVANPWVTFWTAPRVTLDAILATNPARYLWILVLFGGVSRTLGRIPSIPFQEPLTDDMIRALAFLGGPLLGLIIVFVIGRLLHLIVRRLGGTATWVESRTAVAWALAPSVPSVALWTIMYLSYGSQVFSPDAIANVADSGTQLILTVDYFIQSALTIWMLALEILLLAKVHKVSAWRVLGAEALLAVVSLVPLFALALFMS